VSTVPPTTIHLVRHADVHNPAEIIYGRLPRFGLSARGREQAARTARFFADKPLAAIYTSPQLRARQTAAAIAAYHPHLPVRISVLLAEIRTSWEGTPAAALGKYFNFYDPLRDPRDESIADIFRRMQRIIRSLCRRHPGHQVVCVTHGDPIIIARTGYAGLALDFAGIRRPEYPERASVTSLTFDGDCQRPTIQYVDPARELPAPS
jgi:probable phosphoglycerate mutase